MKKKKFNVSWNMVYCCQSVVEAESKDEAIQLAVYGEDGPDQKMLDGNVDINVCEEDDEEEDD